MSEDDIRTVMRHPLMTMGSDSVSMTIGGRSAEGKPHPRTYGAFVRILCRYVREQGVLTLEEAVRRMTSLPASRAGLAELGALGRGLYADIVVFDPASVCDRATFEHPERISVGIEHVIVNGVAVLRDGTPTGERPGRGLRFRGTGR